MRWLQLHLRSRRVPLAFTIALSTMALTWALSRAYSDSSIVNVRTATITIMLAVVALGTTLSGADDALDRTASINWPVRRAGHLLLGVAVIIGLLSLSAVTDPRFEPFALLLRNTVGLLGLTALGAALLGAALAWIAPLTWTIIAIMPNMGPSDELRKQVVAWLLQPTDTTAATVCAATLGVAGLLAYALRGCPARPAAETFPAQ